MMNAKYTLLLLLMVGSFSCKKDNEAVSSSPYTELESVLQKVQRRWDFKMFYHKEIIGGMLYRDRIVGVSGDFFEFSKNGVVHSFWDGIADSVQYSVLMSVISFLEVTRLT